MKKIIALWGAGQRGKTSTIKMVYDILLRKYAKIIDYFPSEHDIKILMQDVKKLIVGIESQGDPNTRLKDSLKDFDKAGCDIIFCATRTCGMTVDWVEKYSKKYDIIYFEQTIVENDEYQQEKSNKAMAEKLIAEAGL